jgi:hypothetical protein
MMLCLGGSVFFIRSSDSTDGVGLKSFGRHVDGLRE